MIFHAPYDIHEKIYFEHLRELGDIKFTTREIDIVACILHHRGEKKIAYILHIMPKTVSAHVFNIMQKLRCNSKDSIIDFFEKSGKISFINQYYLGLLVKNDFKKHLIKIGKEINQQPITYIFNVNMFKDKPEQEKFFNKLSADLKLANINIQVQGNSVNTIFNEWDQIKINGYFDWTFQFVKKLIGNNEIDSIITEFKAGCRLLDNPGTVDNSSLSQKRALTLNAKQFLQIKFMYALVIAIISSIIIILIASNI